MDVGEEVAAIQVTPESLVGVVMQPAIMAALGTWPPQSLPVLEMDVDPLLLRIEVDAPDRPGRIDAEKMPVELRVLHGTHNAPFRA